MNRIFLPTLTLLATVSSLTPFAGAARAAEYGTRESFNLHQQRIDVLDSRNKNSDNPKEGFNLHQSRMSGLDERNKVGDKLSTTPLIVQRQRVLDRRGSK